MSAKEDQCGRDRRPLVRHRDQVAPLDCPYGHVQRVVTGGSGGVANVHIVNVAKGTTHVHAGYDEVYYVLSGEGQITLADQPAAIRSGSVVVIPAGVPHSLEAREGQTLEFIIFGTPPMDMSDPRAQPLPS